MQTHVRMGLLFSLGQLAVCEAEVEGGGSLLMVCINLPMGPCYRRSVIIQTSKGLEEYVEL